MKISIKKIVAIVIAVAVVVAGGVLFAMSKHDTNADVNLNSSESESNLEVANPVVDESPESPADDAVNNAPVSDPLAGINLESGGDEIQLNEDGIYSEEPISEEPERPEVEPSTDMGYSSFDEIDTSKLDYFDEVVVNGTIYSWVGDLTDDPSGFMEVTNSNGQHIDAHFELTGNIIGY